MPGLIRALDSGGNSDRMRVSAPSRISVYGAVPGKVSELVGVTKNRRGDLLLLTHVYMKPQVWFFRAKLHIGGPSVDLVPILRKLYAPSFGMGYCLF